MNDKERYDQGVSVQLTLVNGDDSFVPAYAKYGDAGCDGRANVARPVYVMPGQTVIVPLGIKVAVPVGYEIQLRPRSGLAAKHSISLGNAVGTIDAGYRNEVGAIIINHGHLTYTINPGDRICQIVLKKVEQIKWDIVEELPASERGEGGFGHTGV